MTIELRPIWCLNEALISTVIQFDDWMIEDKRATEHNGDDWQPGNKILITRNVSPIMKPAELRRRLGLTAGQVVGIAARWTCRDTSNAGVHNDGPTPIKLIGETTLTLDVPAEVARSIEIETYLIVKWSTDEQPPGAVPDHSILWSDSWTLPNQERSVLLEGAESRIPVRSVSFKQQFGEASSALWAIDLDTSVVLDDLLANVVTILLNTEVTSRAFRGIDNEFDASKIPDALLTAIKVDLMRGLISTLCEELNDVNWTDLRDLKGYEDGSVGQWLGIHLIIGFGSTSRAVNAYRQDESLLNRELWNLFAPNSWSAAR